MSTKGLLLIIEVMFRRLGVVAIRLDVILHADGSQQSVITPFVNSKHSHKHTENVFGIFSHFESFIPSFT